MSRNHDLLAVDYSPFAIGGGKVNVGPYDIGLLVADLFQHKYRELMAVLDAEEFAKKLLSWVRLHGPQEQLSMEEQLAWAEIATLELLQRGAVKPVIETPYSTADIRKLEAAVAKANLRPAPVAIADPEPVAVPADPVDECARNFRVLSSGEFRAKWMTPSNRPVFDEAVRQGRI